MAAGTALSLGLTLAGLGRVWGLHAGLLGLALNALLCVVLSRRNRPTPKPRVKLERWPYGIS